MKDIKINQSLLFGILGFIFTSIIIHLYIFTYTNRKSKELEIRTAGIQENANFISDQINNLELECPPCPENKECPPCNCPEHPDCTCPEQAACNCPEQEECPESGQPGGYSEQRECPPCDCPGNGDIDSINHIFSDFSLNLESDGRFIPHKCTLDTKPDDRSIVEGFDIKENFYTRI